MNYRVRRSPRLCRWPSTVVASRPVAARRASPTASRPLTSASPSWSRVLVHLGPPGVGVLDGAHPVRRCVRPRRARQPRRRRACARGSAVAAAWPGPPRGVPESSSKGLWAARRSSVERSASSVMCLRSRPAKAASRSW